MNKLYLIILLAFCFSCSDEFLNEFPNDAVPQNQAITNENEMVQAIIGLMDNFQANGGFGRDLMVYGDFVSDNGFVSNTNSNRFVAFDRRNYTTLNGNIAGTWLEMYRIIKDANFIIQEGEALPQTANRDFYLGQAYIARGLAHFELVRLFAKQPTSGLNQDLGVPYVTSFDAFQQPARNSVSEVYSLMKQDIMSGIELMGEQDPGVVFLSPMAGKLLLSRIALYEQDWSKALTYATDVINNSGLTLVSSGNYANYWSSDNQGETIFQVSLTPDDNPGFNSLAYIYDPNGYAQNLAYESLVASYDADDVRGDLYLLADGRGDEPAGYYVRKWPYIASQYDIKVLRLSEAYLNAAEAAFYSNESTARQFLNTLAANRYTDGTQFTSSGAQLLNDILTERRKELAFENHRLFDLLRYGNDVNKPSNCLENCTMPYYADQLVFPIPEAEFDGNQNMVQNPGY